MVTKHDYTQEAVDAARSVIIELVHLLGQYRDHIVIIGGWVPYLLLPEQKDPFIGSIDIDLALNHQLLQDEGYKTIQELLLGRGYEQGRQPFIFFRTVQVQGKAVKVQIDLLSGEYAGTATGHRHQKVQDVLARKVRGCDLAFEHPFETTVEGYLPNGGKDTVQIRVASIVPFLVMKGMALHDRLKEKDSWDIYYCVKNYPGGLDAIVSEFKSYLDNSMVREGLVKIADKFKTENHIGPTHVAAFEDVGDTEEGEMLKRDAFERIQYLLSKLKKQS